LSASASLAYSLTNEEVPSSRCFISSLFQAIAIAQSGQPFINDFLAKACKSFESMVLITDSSISFEILFKATGFPFSVTALTIFFDISLLLIFLIFEAKQLISHFSETFLIYHKALFGSILLIALALVFFENSVTTLESCESLTFSTAVLNTSLFSILLNQLAIF
jgi:hypothetical protein